MTTPYARRAVQRQTEARRANRRAFVLWLAGLHCTLTVGTLALLVVLGWFL